VEALLEALFALSPEGPAWYDADCYTDQDPRFRIAEIVRGAAIARLRDELPHALYVDVPELSLKPAKPAQAGQPAGRGTLFAQAVIFVERESQKGMVVGKGGKMIHDIRIAALRDLKKVFEWKVELDLRVKTAPDWRKNAALLRKLTA